MVLNILKIISCIFTGADWHLYLYGPAFHGQKSKEEVVAKRIVNSIERPILSVIKFRS